jgi:hypothetical protein
MEITQVTDIASIKAIGIKKELSDIETIGMKVIIEKAFDHTSEDFGLMYTSSSSYAGLFANNGLTYGEDQIRSFVVLNNNALVMICESDLLPEDHGFYNKYYIISGY